MPRITNTGTVHSDIYPGRMIITFPPPGEATRPTVEFIVATRNSIDDVTIGIQIDRQPKNIPYDVFKNFEVDIRGTIIRGDAWLAAVLGFFEDAYAAAAENNPDLPVPPEPEPQK